MALNCSSRSLLVTDECAGMMLGCGCRSEEASPLSSCGVNSLWWDDLELELEEEVEESDPVDLLPTDPFGMNLETTFTAAIASCIGDLTVMSGAGHFGSCGDDALFADLSYYLNQAFLVPEPWIGGHMGVFEGSFGSGGLHDDGGPDQFSRLPPNASCSERIGFVEDPSSCDASLAFGDTIDAAPVQEGNDAHEGMVFVLSYLGLRDLLSVEMVCKSLRSAVRNEPFLWKCIHVDSHLGKKMFDDDLLRLTQKAQGSLECLSLVDCMKITDQGLKAVLEGNLHLTKLGIFGTMLLTQQGLLDNLRSFNMKAVIGIKKLRVANLFTASEVQYKELLSSLRIDKEQTLHKPEPRIFHADCLLPDLHGGYVPDYSLPDLHDEYALDIEKCPLCPNYKLVYDCPAEGCTGTSGTCRGCIVCINRCLRCGRCIDSEYEETFSLHNVCCGCQPEEDSPAAEK